MEEMLYTVTEPEDRRFVLQRGGRAVAVLNLSGTILSPEEARTHAEAAFSKFILDVVAEAVRNAQ